MQFYAEKSKNLYYHEGHENHEEFLTNFVFFMLFMVIILSMFFTMPSFFIIK